MSSHYKSAFESSGKTTTCKVNLSIGRNIHPLPSYVISDYESLKDSLGYPTSILDTRCE